VHQIGDQTKVLLILFVFILKKEIWLKMLYDQIIYRTCFWFNTSTSQNVGKMFLFAALSYAFVWMESILVEVVSMRNSEVKRGTFRQGIFVLSVFQILRMLCTVIMLHKVRLLATFFFFFFFLYIFYYYFFNIPTHAHIIYTFKKN
jgi:hypothetical protein